MPLEFPDLGSVRTVPMFPDAEAGAPAADVTVDVKLVGAGKARAWAQRVAAIKQRDAKRLAQLREGTTAKTAPTLWEDAAITEEGANELQGAYRDVLSDGLVGVAGVVAGPKKTEDVKETAELVELLEAVGLLDATCVAVLNAQQPSEAESFFTASPQS